MKKLNLDDWLTRIESAHPVSWDLGLERVGRVGRTLDLIHPGERVVLVAGTNGKGSTCKYLSDMGRMAGLKVGLTTSPHLFKFNERIEIDGQPVEDDEIVSAFEAIETARGDTSLTYFEFASLAAMFVFRQNEVDLTILEVGLGGRLDAMNIVEPDLCIITSIALDHESWLGDSREAIGGEKAGILREGTPLVLGEPDPPDSIMKEVNSLCVPIKAVGHDFPLPEEMDCSLPAASYACARQAAQILDLKLSESQFRDIASNSRLIGRKTLIDADCKVLLDVAHNPAAAKFLTDYLKTLNISGDMHALIGIYSDKDISGVISACHGIFKSWHVTDLPEERAASADYVAAQIFELDVGEIQAYANIDSALETVQRVVEPQDLLVVFGSFATVASAIEHLEKQQDNA